jgi:hypothetical protein
MLMSGAAALLPVATSAPAPNTLTIDITSPQQNEYVPSSSVLVRWTAQDTTYDVVRFQVFVDDPGFTSPRSTTSQQLEISAMADGQHTVVVRGYNSGGGFSQSSVLFYVDTTAPGLRIVSPTDGAWSNHSDVTVSWESSGANGIAYFEARVDSSPWITPIPYDQMSNTFQNVSNGPHNVTVMAHGWGGQTSTVTVSFNVDTTIPTVNITSPSDGKGFNHSDVTVVWSGADAGNNIAGYQIWVDGTKVTTAIPGENNFNDLFADGYHTVRIVVVDIANSTASDEVTFLVDTVLPRVLTRMPVGGQEPVNAQIVVNFSKAMDPAASSMTVDGVKGEVRWDGNMARFIPAVPLAYDTTFNVTLDAQDMVGNKVLQSWTFTTTDMGTIAGVVTDQGGNPLSGVKVALDNGDVSVTNDKGEFMHEAHAGTHNLTLSKLGWDGRTVMVNLKPGQTLTLDSMEVTPVNPLATYGIIAAVAAVVLVGLIYMVGRRRRMRRPPQHRSMRGMEDLQRRSRRNDRMDDDEE